MQLGTVKWFDTSLGYGFIAPKDGSPDIFVHFTALDIAGLKALSTGTTVAFEPSRDGGVMRATNLRMAQAA